MVPSSIPIGLATGQEKRTARDRLVLKPVSSPEGKMARSKTPLERPEEGFPNRIGAVFTRDWPQVSPGRKPLYQAGFLVARRDPSVIDEVLEVVREGNYTSGFGIDNGWGGGGYGGLVGAIAMQGLTAYYYDEVRSTTKYSRRTQLMPL
jgi:hypothetical protein